MEMGGIVFLTIPLSFWFQEGEFIPYQNICSRPLRRASQEKPWF